MPIAKELTEQIIGAAIEAHRELGPGLLESAYEDCLCHELELRRVRYARRGPFPVTCKGIQTDCGYRLDVVVELKAAEALLPVHSVRLPPYLRLTGKRVGRLINFNVPVLRDGVLRKVL